MLFAEETLYKRQSIKGNLAFLCRLRRLPKSQTAAVISRVGLADHANERVAKLPSGLARRLAFGCAILHEPAVLLLAEPFDRCDEATISLLTGLIKKLAEGGTAGPPVHINTEGHTVYPRPDAGGRPFMRFNEPGHRRCICGGVRRALFDD